MVAHKRLLRNMPVRIGALMINLLLFLFLLISMDALWGFYILRLPLVILRKVRKLNTSIFNYALSKVAFGEVKVKLEKIEYIFIQTKSKITYIEAVQVLGIVTSLVFLAFAYSKNYLLAVLIPIGMIYLAYHVLLFNYYSYLTTINKDLNFALSMITSHYVKNHDLIKSIRDNLHRIPKSIREVFAEFLVRADVIDSDLVKGVDKLKEGINNYYFYRWCNVVVQCVDDRDYIKVLPAVVSEMTDAQKSINNFEIYRDKFYKEHFQLVLIAALTPFVMRLAFYEMYYYLTSTIMGQLLIAVNYFILMISTSQVIIINKPIGLGE